MIILQALNVFGGLMFWLAFMCVLLKSPTMFNGQPWYIWWPLFIGMILSGGAGILLWFFK